MVRRVLVVVLLATLLPLVGTTGTAQAQTPAVVISELHYHPQAVGTAFPDFDDREDTEFLELLNVSGSPVDVSGWCVRDGVDYCFPVGSTLAPNAPFVIARDAARFSAVHGFAPDAIYTSRLANSGELVRLVDAGLGVVMSVDYRTTDPWPVTPDGNGPSLELVALTGALGGPANWAASTETDGTPGAAPALTGAAPPLVLSHTAPTPAVAGQPVTVQASAVNTTSIAVVYNVDFGADTVAPMAEAAGSWSAQLPALATGQVMRFRFEATGPGGTTTSPRVDDSITWWATAVPTQPVSAVPTLDIHISDANWNDIENLDCGCTATIVHEGRVWTDVAMRRSGLTSLNLPKGSYRLDFPDGHPFVASWLTGDSDELTLDMGYPNHDQIREQLSWQMMDDLGFPPIQTQHVRVSRNGDFHGLYLLREEQDGDWRARHGFDRGAFYKVDSWDDSFGFSGNFTKKEALDEPDTDLITFRSCLDQTGTALRTCLLDQADVAQMVHEIASMALIRQIDQREFNWFLWRDDTQGGLWRLLPDDLDRTWGIDGANEVLNPVADSGKPYRRCVGTDGTPANEVCRAIMRVPEFEEMYNRRLRTLVDEHLADPKWPANIAATAALIEIDWNDDENRWNRTSGSFSFIVGELTGWVADYVTHLRTGGHDGEVPAAQSAEPAVAIIELRADVGDGFTYALITNPSATESVDISGWAFAGLATIADGAVILPGATIAVTNDDIAFRSAQPGFTGVRAYLDGSVAGQAQLVRRDGSVVADVGTPPANPLILNEWNAVSASNVLAGGDPTFGTAAGNGGDWFELVVTVDHLDIRGWRLVLSDSETGTPGVRDEFVFADRPELADLERGLIITISEDHPDDLTYRPVNGDWHINLQANALDAGAYFTADSQENFDTNHHDWQLAIYDDAGGLVFGPAGEGIGGASGVNNAEVGELEIAPSQSVDRLIDYGDGDASTFGAANESGGIAQDFSALRFAYARGDVNCNGVFDIADALIISQLTVGARVAEARCPLAAPTLGMHDGVADMNDNGTVDIVDALIISQCTVGVDYGNWCPDG